MCSLLFLSVGYRDSPAYGNKKGVLNDVLYSLLCRGRQKRERNSYSMKKNYHNYDYDLSYFVKKIDSFLFSWKNNNLGLLFFWRTVFIFI